jgi:hypothetical protein
MNVTGFIALSALSKIVHAYEHQIDVNHPLCAADQSQTTTLQRQKGRASHTACGTGTPVIFETLFPDFWGEWIN